MAARFRNAEEVTAVHGDPGSPGALLKRRDLMAAGAAIAGRRAAGVTQEQAGFAVVETRYGRVRGIRGDGLVTFKGVPYAGPVAGRNRFRKAPPLEPWSGVRDALLPEPPSLQPGRTTARGQEPAPVENCLYLNIWTPAADGKKLSVMVYSHGGGFTTGSGSAPSYCGGYLARKWDVVVVATNHQLGLMGFL